MKKKSILNSPKPYRNPKWLGPQDKVEDMGPILGAPEKYPHPLDKRFMGCSKDTQGNPVMEEEHLTYKEFSNSLNPEEKMCPSCGQTFKTIHSKNQKYCCATCEEKDKTLSHLHEAFMNFGAKKVTKAGFLPYYRDKNGVVRFLFVMSSDPQYGGDRFMIAKGHIDKRETPIQTGLREGNEECGLKQSNLKPGTTKIGWQGEITGMTETSEMIIYIGEVIDPVDFDKPGFEVSSTKWMTSEEFYSTGRQSQVKIVRSCAGKV